ncbi:adenylyltransferase/cytidyltransferase family protein [Pullulanibacillus sp. KACC 23026]|uniref:adenylyltransferase/cytidyltransferase family protein n=1 Tax=Pullulanibacillus sp. KACC 23026 TaxID=3028315 RepID=UPI0023B01089|nr:adenylyltransferase/cytidyltransferase family protein [Pullulanibacillus sp. KACC 23026]WEG11508.1 adenylyltransferase/cytidyltransferase family protein [Pullulanibacillus sp. KACC 23026]
MKPFKVGYTTGVFDMFHVGHLNILQRAKNLCDFLIVGVSTDELVMTYKNKLPVIPYLERREIIESIKYVDQVVAQENRDKFSAWEAYKFDAMFVGDDWRGNELFNEVEVKLNGVGTTVVYLPYTQGVSSSLLREKVRL